MILNELTKHQQQTKIIKLTERLPDFILGPCELKVDYRVEAVEDYYLIHLQVTGELMIICQRCLQEFKLPYDNSTLIAACFSEKRANQLLRNYECIVSENGQIVLEDLIIDELYLYAPQFHPDSCFSISSTG
jgi:uncharacterized protein